MQAPPLTEVACPHCGGPASEEIFWSTLPGETQSVRKRQIRCASQPVKRRAFGLPRKAGCPVWQEILAPIPCVQEPLDQPEPEPQAPAPSAQESRQEPQPEPRAEPRVRRRLPAVPPRDPLEPALGLLSQLPDEVLEDVARLARLHREARARLQALRDQLDAARLARN